MEVGIVGLGLTGVSISRRLLRDGHKVYAYDQSESCVAEAEVAGAVGLSSIEELVRMRAPRTVWVAVPAGSTTETVDHLAGLLTAEDTMVDAGDSFYKDSIERHKKLKVKGIHFLDAGSGNGIKGSLIGYCLMIGGEQEPFKRVEPLFSSLAGQEGYALVGGPGAGHFARMVHRAIGEALMQSYAEGLEVLHSSGFNFDLVQVAQLWNRGGAVRSWLLELVGRTFAKTGDMAAPQDDSTDPSESRCTVQEAMGRDIPPAVITLSSLARCGSPPKQSFQAKVLAALRVELGNQPTEVRHQS